MLVLSNFSAFFVVIVVTIPLYLEYIWIEYNLQIRGKYKYKAWWYHELASFQRSWVYSKSLPPVVKSTLCTSPDCETVYEVSYLVSTYMQI